MVPKELRDKVWKEARRMWDGESGGAEGWREAADQAVAAVEMKESS